MMNEEKLKELSQLLESRNGGKIVEYIKDMLYEATAKRINRIRGGKIQKNKRVSDKPGYKMVKGKLVRMTAQERRNRSKSQREGSRKRRSKQSQINRKRQRSNKIRKSRNL